MEIMVGEIANKFISNDFEEYVKLCQHDLDELCQEVLMRTLMSSSLEFLDPIILC